MKTTLCLLINAALLLIAAAASAQSAAFTYQGHLTENSAAAQSAQDLTFTLYNAASGGATVGTSNVVHDLAISNGLFTVTLDFGAFDGTARWLQLLLLLVILGRFNLRHPRAGNSFRLST